MKNPGITLTPQHWAAIRWIFEEPAADGAAEGDAAPSEGVEFLSEVSE